MITHNKQRKPLDLVTDNPAGMPVTVLTFETGLDEAERIARRIREAVVSGKRSYRDFARPASERRLFPGIEPSVLPGSSENDAKIRKTIVHLHEKILGRYDAVDSAEIERTFKLFAAIVKDASEQKGLDKRENYFCRPNNRDAPGAASDDPHYTIRAWRGVVTYLLRRQEFLYE